VLKIKKFKVQFLEDDQKTKKGDEYIVFADSKKQAIRKSCKLANIPYPPQYFSLVGEYHDPPATKPKESKPKQKSKDPD